MLVLTRKLGERIVVPEIGLSITVLKLRSNQVSLGIKAPAKVAVHRGEVWQRIDELHAESPRDEAPAR